MINICKLLPKQLSLTSQCLASVRQTSLRYKFSQAYFGIENFKKHSAYVQKTNEKNTDAIRTTVQQAVDKQDAKIFTEDLKTFLYLTNTETDLDLLLKGIQKYEKQETLPIFNFDFGSPFMRLCTILNKNDKALDLFLSQEPNFMHKSATSGLILINNLYDEKKYDLVLKASDKFLQIHKDKKLSLDFLKIVCETLLAKNDEEALKRALDIVKLTNEQKISLPNKALTALFLLAVENNKYEMAYELSTQEVKTPTAPTYNIKIIGLALIDRIDEALDLALKLKTLVTSNRLNNFYFKKTVEVLESKLKQSNNPESIKKLDQLIEKITRENLYLTDDIKDYVMKEQTTKYGKTRNINNDKRQGQFKNRQTTNDGLNEDNYKSDSRSQGFNNRNRQNNKISQERNTRQRNIDI